MRPGVIGDLLTLRLQARSGSAKSASLGEMRKLQPYPKDGWLLPEGLPASNFSTLMASSLSTQYLLCPVPIDFPGPCFFPSLLVLEVNANREGTHLRLS